MQRPAQLPATTRFTLAAMALAGNAAYAFVLLGPLTAVLVLNPWAAYYGPWPLLLTLLVLSWALAPHSALPGQPVQRSDAEAVFAEAHALADRMRAPRIHALRLTDELNAAALEARVPWQPWRRQRTLLLGVPLLALADAATVRAVVAHELGHFSRQHGRMGQWLYRVRMRWLAYAAETGPDAQVSLWERGAAAFAGWFAPRFSRRSLAWARQCEFEADAFGASVVGAPQMAAALFNIELLAERWQAMHQNTLPELVASREAPPADWLNLARQNLLGTPPDPGAWGRLTTHAAQAHDTHPALAERVAALGVAPAVLQVAPAWATESAGANWLRRWPTELARYNQHWHDRLAPAWRSDHLTARHLQARLAALREAKDTGTERCRLELNAGDPAVALQLAKQLPADPAAQFVRGVALLRNGQAAGVEVLEACIRQDPIWAVAARATLAEHSALLPDGTAAKRNQALLKRARQKRSQAAQQILLDVPLARIEPLHLDKATTQLLRQALSTWPAVAGAWCASAETEVAARRYTARILVLRLRPKVLDACSQTDDDVSASGIELLQRLLPPPALTLAWPAYTTEPLTPELDALLARWVNGQDDACLVAPAAGECVGAGVRATALG